MIDLEWHELPDGYGSGDYLIRRAFDRPGTPWMLDVTDRTVHWQGRRGFTPSFHATLKGARDRASRVERERLIQRRVIGHGIVAVVASLVFVALAPAIDSIGEFVLALVALYVALRSFAFAISVRLGDAWGWTRDKGRGEHITWSDRAVAASMARLRRRAMKGIDVDGAGPVRPLPPEPPA